MSDWQVDFFESCCLLADGAAMGEGAFSPGPALWVGRREVAHFDRERTLDVRLTKAEIRTQRTILESDGRVFLRKGSSDWLEILVESDDDIVWARRLVVAAVEANIESAPKPDRMP